MISSRIKEKFRSLPSGTGFLRNISLKNYMLIFNFSIIILETLLLMFMPMQIYSLFFTRQAEEYSSDIVTQTSYGVLSTVNELDWKIEQLIHDDAFLDIIRNNPPSFYEYQKYRNLIASYFPPQSLESFYLQELDLYVKGQHYAYTYGSKPTSVTEPFKSPYFMHALIYPTKLNWMDYNVESDCIEITHLIYDHTTYETLAYIVIRLSKNFLLDKFNAYNKIDIDNMFITNDNGDIFCANKDELLDKTLENGLIEAMSKDSGVIHAGKEFTVYCRYAGVGAPFQYQDWCTIIQLDKSKILKDFKKVFLKMNLLALAFIIVTVFITLRLSKTLSDPVKSLVHAMDQIRGGNLKYTISVKSPVAEFKLVENGFNEMADRLDYLIMTVYEDSLIKKDMQLKALQSQINPHFLFNTLQLISLKAHEYGADQISDMIYSLSCMLDTDLYHGDENEFSLREEIDYINHYATIIHYKYDNRIQITLDVPDELLDSKIPKLILQPFIENAVVHGLIPKTTPGSVLLSAVREGEDLFITIRDDGIGMRYQALSMLQNDDSAATNFSDRDSHHIALKNIRNRIRILYGEKYGFTIESQLHSGTTITLRIPFQERSAG